MNGSFPISAKAALTLCLLPILMAYALAHGAEEGQLFSPADLGYLTITQFALLTIIMLFVWYKSPDSDNLNDYKWLLVVAVIARCALIPITPYTSNDIDRYLFDGYIASSGLDPYSISHNAAQLADKIHLWNPPAEHAKYVTLYPPLAVALYAVAASTGPEFAPIVWKVMIAMASLATLLFSVRTLRHLNKLKYLSLIALSPILILEAGIGAHIDSFAALFVSMAIYYWVTKKHFIVGVCIGLGVLVKLLPLVLIGPLFLYASNWIIKRNLTLGLVASLALGYSIAFAVGWLPFGSLGVFFEKFRFGSPLFTLLENALSSKVLAITIPIILLLGYGILAIYSLIVGKQQDSTKLLVALQVSFSLPLLLGPVVYPWYLMALVPLVAVAPKPWLLVWLSILPITYEVLGPWLCCQQWQPSTWPLIVTALSVLLSLAFTTIRTHYSTVFTARLLSPFRSEAN
ncbi:DUF2029 domain-containing protein [Alteromonas sp. 5E99-2]|uniref:glycosyltransferase 87 family protein n=1 Tax=Alteromonas sp. 5E99-2 TaxID=2817683 RepID=UPI001A99574C|nr:glycosyltransferase 87 family protein [Alteromonas sp. 5E99-2]MBO1256579.1 DUF2029 domain-containing protein [Alteromonas sp. 5E99-2]